MQAMKQQINCFIGGCLNTLLILKQVFGCCCYQFSYRYQLQQLPLYRVRCFFRSEIFLILNLAACSSRIINA